METVLYICRKNDMIDINALFNISYGMYAVVSGNSEIKNGFISNTVFQITAEPPRFCVSCNKDNYTSELIKQFKVFSISILHEEAKMETIGLFGYKSGRDTNKFESIDVEYSENNIPYLKDDSIAVLQFKLINTIEVDTHYLFIGELIFTEMLDDSKQPMTYSFYRQVKKGFSPKNAPTYIDKSQIKNKIQNKDKRIFKCSACGYEYDESEHELLFSELSSDYECPVCGCGKSDFYEI